MKLNKILLLMTCILLISKQATASDKYLSLSVRGDYIRIPHCEAVNFKSDFSVEFIGQLNADDALCIYKRGNKNKGFGLSIRSNTINYGICSRFDSKLNKIADKGEWNHYAFVRRGSICEIYINGILVLTKSGKLGVYPTSSDIMMSVSINADGTIRNYYTGKYDELRLWNKALTEREIKNLSTSKITGQENNLVGYYKFNEMIMQNKIRDWSAVGNHAYVVGSPQLVAYEQKNDIAITDQNKTGSNNTIINKAIQFDGVDDKLKVEINPILSPKNSFTYELWVKPKGSIKISKMENRGISGTRGQRYLIFPYHGDQLGNNRAGSGLSVGINGVVLNEHRGNYMPSLLVYEKNIEDWTHIAVVYTENQASLYINGSFVMRGLKSIISDVYFIPTQIGSNSQKYGNFTGMIDELRVWNRSLTEQEIKTYYKNTLDGNEKGLILYYNFNNIESDGRIKDLSGNKHTGILEGGTKLVESLNPIKLRPKEPPKLRVETTYQDDDENGVLEHLNKGRILVDIRNESRIASDKIEVNLKCLTSDMGDGLITLRSVERDDNLARYLETFEIENLKSPKTDSIICEISIKYESSGTNYTFDPATIIIPTKKSYAMPDRPADLYIENLVFNEPSNNKALDGYEKGSIEFALTNNGMGKAQNINIILSPLTSDNNLIYKKNMTIDLIEGKTSQNISIPIEAKGSVATLSRSIRIQASEEFGFDADPITLTFETVAFNPPDLRIERVAINDREEGDAYGNGNSIIEPNESIIVTAYVQNYGVGLAEDVQAKVLLETDNRHISYPDDGKITQLDTISPGDYKPVEFYFYTSKRYNETDIPLKIELTESKGDYGKTLDLGLKMNNRTENIIDVNIAKIDIKAPEIKEIEGFTKSDIDEVINESTIKRPTGLAVIIGIENYKYAPPAAYASRDAGAFYNYAYKVLGIPEANIYYLVDDGATVGEFNKLFEKDGWLSRRAAKDTDIFVFYSGHGAPDIKTNIPYLIPYDIDPNYAQNGYPINLLYQNLSKLETNSVTVMLDACFSGQTKDNEMLFAGAKPALLSVEASTIPSNVTVLSASSGSQISSGFPNQKHGIFSYYLMKGLSSVSDQNKDGVITLSELYNYISENVKKTASTLDREQTPELICSDKNRIVCEY